jgi:hypothetical protein
MLRVALAFRAVGRNRFWKLHRKVTRPLTQPRAVFISSSEMAQAR